MGQHPQYAYFVSPVPRGEGGRDFRQPREAGDQHFRGRKPGGSIPAHLGGGAPRLDGL